MTITEDNYDDDGESCDDKSLHADDAVDEEDQGNQQGNIRKRLGDNADSDSDVDHYTWNDLMKV